MLTYADALTLRFAAGTRSSAIYLYAYTPTKWEAFAALRQELAEVVA
jgi:hypothetical protein